MNSIVTLCPIRGNRYNSEVIILVKELPPVILQDHAFVYIIIYHHHRLRPAEKLPGRPVCRQLKSHK